MVQKPPIRFPLSDLTKRVIGSFALGLPAAVVGVVLRKALQVWGVLDPIAVWLGLWLKVHVSPAQAEWTVATVIALVGYGLALWFVWRHFRAPVWSVVEGGHLAQSIVREVQNATEPEIEVEVGNGEPFEFVEHTVNASLRIIRARVTNKSDRIISGCHVYVDHVVPSPSWSVSGGVQLLKDLQLHPNAPVYVDVVAYNEGTPTRAPDEHIRLMVAPAGAVWNGLEIGNLPLVEHMIDIDVVSAEGFRAFAKCRLWVDAEHHLRIEKVGTQDSAKSENDLRNAEFWKAVEHVSDVTGEAKDGNYFPESRAAIRQAALDGKMQVWGRKQIEGPDWVFSQVLTEIPRTYWENWKIAPAAAIDQLYKRIPFTQPEFEAGWKERKLYADLHVNLFQVFEIWPRKFKQVGINIIVSKKPPDVEWKIPTEALCLFANPRLLAERDKAYDRIHEASELVHEPEQNYQEWNDKSPGGIISEQQAIESDRLRKLLVDAVEAVEAAKRHLSEINDEILADFMKQLKDGTLLAKGFPHPHDHGDKVQIDPERWRHLQIEFLDEDAIRKRDNTTAFTELMSARSV